jgi:methoxymalonate biosynthesis acyl carrier protein
MNDGTRKRIHDFVISITRAPQIRGDEDIFKSGYVNSLAALEIVVFIEHEVGAKIGNDDLVMDNFRSVDAMTRLAERLVAAGDGKAES